MHPVLTRSARQKSPLRRAVDQAADTLEIALRDTLLHIDADPVTRGNRDQTVPAAVADVEASVRAPAAHHSEGLAVFALAEGELPVAAAQPLGKDDAERGPAERELPPGPIRQEAPKARCLGIVEKGDGLHLALGVWREINVEDGGAICLAPGTPPSVVHLRHRLENTVTSRTLASARQAPTDMPAVSRVLFTTAVIAVAADGAAPDLGSIPVDHSLDHDRRGEYLQFRGSQPT